MAVYTDLSEEILRPWLEGYDLGALVAFRGIAEGIENSNFLLETTQGRFILTLFEKRVNPADLPWFLGLMTHLAQQGVTCPRPVPARDGRALGELARKPAVIVSFLEGRSLDIPDEKACFQAGRALAQLHEAGRGYEQERPNALGPSGWGTLLETCRKAGQAPTRGEEAGGETKALHALEEAASRALARLLPAWPAPGGLPHGQIHADFFPDNVFFRHEDGEIVFSGVIDFYFACTDFFAYDLAIVLNSWCFEEKEGKVIYVPEKARAVIRGYEEIRVLEKAEREALPILCQGAALRFLLTRLYDWVNTPSGALVTRKDPAVYAERLKTFSENPFKTLFN